MCVSVCVCVGDQKASSYLLTYFCSMAPETTADYVEPSLLFLTNYYQDPMGTPPLLLAWTSGFLGVAPQHRYGWADLNIVKSRQTMWYNPREHSSRHPFVECRRTTSRPLRVLKPACVRISLDLPRTTGFGGLLTGPPSHVTVAIRPAEERENRILMLAVLGAEKPECLEPRYVPPLAGY